MVTWSKVDKVYYSLFFLVLLMCAMTLLVVDTSLIFDIKYIDDEYWFVKNLELFILSFFVYGMFLGYSIGKYRRKN